MEAETLMSPAEERAYKQQTQLRITAKKVAEHLPMTVEILDKSNGSIFFGAIVTFTKVITSKPQEWTLLGKTADKTKTIAIFDKDEEFGVIE